MISGEEMLRHIKLRQSDRGYEERPVEKEKLERILEAGRMAPSACNSQPWKFIVVDEPDLKSKIADAASAKALGFNRFTREVPVFIIIVREKPKVISRIGGTIKDRDYSLIDVGTAAENICLQAAAEGLGSCMLGWFNEKLVKKFLKVPAGKRAELIITLGYPSKAYRKKQRKPTEEVVSFNKY
ncbi:MAG TPA: nitroreductase family protein [Bacteroidales bacterium]|nr:nitroreductase family protein [Bacteroidales bacterium]